MLTVEEAGELLRIGRSKAYAMAREWRETDGRSGLPVVDLGNVLRVPRPALEEMIGADLSTIGGDDARSSEIPAEERSHPQAAEAVPGPATQRPRRRQGQNTDQLDLFDQAARHD
jgi:hypothetical protein